MWRLTSAGRLAGKRCSGCRVGDRRTERNQTRLRVGSDTFRGSGHWPDGNLLADMHDAGALAESAEKIVIEKTLAVYRELLG